MEHTMPDRRIPGITINAILASPAYKACNQYGASMGRSSVTEGKPERLHLQKVDIDSGGYDRGGAYWGIGHPIWCAFSPNNTENEYRIEVFVRAPDREAAKGKVRTRLNGSGWTFFK
jgi:hypothetical protein